MPGSGNPRGRRVSPAGLPGAARARSASPKKMQRSIFCTCVQRKRKCSGRTRGGGGGGAGWGGGGGTGVGARRAQGAGRSERERGGHWLRGGTCAASARGTVDTRAAAPRALPPPPGPRRPRAALLCMAQTFIPGRSTLSPGTRATVAAPGSLRQLSRWVAV